MLVYGFALWKHTSVTSPAPFFCFHFRTNQNQMVARWSGLFNNLKSSQSWFSECKREQRFVLKWKWSFKTLRHAYDKGGEERGHKPKCTEMYLTLQLKQATISLRGWDDDPWEFWHAFVCAVPANKTGSPTLLHLRKLRKEHNTEVDDPFSTHY